MRTTGFLLAGVAVSVVACAAPSVLFTGGAAGTAPGPRLQEPGVIDPSGLGKILPGNGICALGKVLQFKEVERNQWEVAFTEIEVLGEDVRNPPEKRLGPPRNQVNGVTLSLTTGLGGVVVTPDKDWVGRTALVLVRRDRDRIIVLNLAFGLAPNGSPFFVFPPNSDAQVRAIRTFAAVLSRQDRPEVQRGLRGIVESGEEPVFLRSFAADVSARIGFADPSTKEPTAAQLIKWRDDSALPIDLRLVADGVLVNHAAPSYQWGERRISFLTAIGNSTDAPEIAKSLARKRLTDARKTRPKDPD